MHAATDTVRYSTADLDSILNGDHVNALKLRPPEFALLLTQNFQLRSSLWVGARARERALKHTVLARGCMRGLEARRCKQDDGLQKEYLSVMSPCPSLSLHLAHLACT